MYKRFIVAGLLTLGLAATSVANEVIEVFDLYDPLSLLSPVGLAMDGAGNLYVSGSFSDNAFKITPGGVVTQIIDSSGDGLGNELDFPRGIDVDSSGNVFVAGFSSNNAFKITPGGVITEIIDESGDGTGNVLSIPYHLRWTPPATPSSPDRVLTTSSRSPLTRSSRRSSTKRGTAPEIRY